MSDDVRTLTGHEPVSLARYIETDPEKPGAHRQYDSP